MANKDTYLKLGQLARQLHESLKAIEEECVSGNETSEIMSTAQKRIEHVERITSDAATKVIDHAENAKCRIEACIAKTRSNEIKTELNEIDTLLTEIIVAQEFQDITGQILRKVLTTLSDVESQLIGTLIENANSLSGPDVPTISKDSLKQTDVDSLLDSLGF